MSGLLTVGEVCAGYGGLSLGLSMLARTRVAWVSEIDAAANRVLADRCPGSPNLGDLTSVDWKTVPTVDILAGGTPCQDLSTAGHRAGMRAGTRSGLWASMARAIKALKPPLVVWENVRGALSSGADSRADSSVESGQGCLGGLDTDGPALRAAGRVLGDLAGLGYDAQWATVTAASVGAPHRRERLFVLAHRRGNGAAADALRVLHVRAPGRGERPESHDRDTRPQHVGALLPTPTVSDRGDGRTPAAWDEWTERMRAQHGNGNGHGRSLSVELRRLFPTPGVQPDQRQSAGYGPSLGDAVRGGFGRYSVAIRHWERVTGREAPAPTEPNSVGKPTLSPVFVEWMMGLPGGHVTGVEGLTRSGMLRILGNGVVPAQAAAAVCDLAGWALASMADRTTLCGSTGGGAA